jgi:phosphoribosylanthranilate isomerase
MTKIKLCGLSRLCEIEAVNELKPEYIGFVFVPGSKRYVSAKQAGALKNHLDPQIQTVGVFVNESLEIIVELLKSGMIDLAQLHGSESEQYIQELKRLTKKPVIKAFSIRSKQDIEAVKASGADYVLVDSGTGGTGRVFDWGLLQAVNRPYFLAGGLEVQNVALALKTLNPYGVDVSSGIETDGYKDKNKMAEFVSAVRKAGRR